MKVTHLHVTKQSKDDTNIKNFSSATEIGCNIIKDMRPYMGVVPVGSILKCAKVADSSALLAGAGGVCDVFGTRFCPGLLGSAEEVTAAGEKAVCIVQHCRALAAVVAEGSRS